LSAYDLEIEQLEAQIKQANDELERLETLYSVDAIPKVDLDKQENTINDLQRQLNTAIQTKQSAIDRHNNEKAGESKSYEQALQENNKTLTDLNYQLQASRLELRYTTEEIEEIGGKLSGNGVYEYHSPLSGEIMKVYEAAKGDRYVSKNTSLLSVQPEDTKYYAVFTLSNDIDYVDIGQSCRLYIKSKNARNIEGFVENIKYNSEDYLVYVSFEYPDIRGGERVETAFEKVSNRYAKVLPNSAIREDQNGNYVLTIERKKTSFGYDYVAVWQYVYVQEEGPSHSAINDSFPDDTVITGSNKTIMEGSKVRIIE
ncbi:HlyD family efflux transporter periplasmic adaptor subunit, partial [Tyzzerella sp. OttesenSCG-928-J15]|nr:HlyD family efflux transporter periplasmic adaptor subunit [Tyzzerella sp. OttesenSCG-928-J15]